MHSLVHPVDKMQFVCVSTFFIQFGLENWNIEIAEFTVLFTQSESQNASYM